MTNQEIKKYLKAVRRGLICKKRTKDEYINGLESELRDYAEQNPALPVAALIGRFGAPREIAAELQEGVGAREYQSAKAARSALILAGYLLLAAIIAALVLYIFRIPTLQAVKEVDGITYIFYGLNTPAAQ